MTPGTSCLATIMLFLWDEYILRAEALIKLALMASHPGPPDRPRLAPLISSPKATKLLAKVHRCYKPPGGYYSSQPLRKTYHSKESYLMTHAIYLMPCDRATINHPFWV
jgi:hypothetical protein